MISINEIEKKGTFIVGIACLYKQLKVFSILVETGGQIRFTQEHGMGIANSILSVPNQRFLRKSALLKPVVLMIARSSGVLSRMSATSASMAMEFGVDVMR